MHHVKYEASNFQYLKVLEAVDRVSHSGGEGMRGAFPHPSIFSKNPLIKTDAPSHLKMKPPFQLKNKFPPLKSESPSQEMIPSKNPEKSETDI